MELPDVFEHQIGQSHSVRGFAARDEVTHLGQAVNHCQNEIMAIGLRQVGDQVVGYVCPWPRRDG